jgi:hypothetical protein
MKISGQNENRRSKSKSVVRKKISCLQKVSFYCDLDNGLFSCANWQNISVSVYGYTVYNLDKIIVSQTG